MEQAVFLIRDGVIHEVHSKRVNSAKDKDLYLLPEAAEAIKTLNDSNYKVFIVNNPQAGTSDTREQKLGMIKKLAIKHRIDLQHSFTIGESGADIVAGRLAGTRTILIIDPDEIIPVIEVDTVVFSLMEAVEWIVEISQLKELSLN